MDILNSGYSDQHIFGAYKLVIPALLCAQCYSQHLGQRLNRRTQKSLLLASFILLKGESSNKQNN